MPGHAGVLSLDFGVLSSPLDLNPLTDNDLLYTVTTPATTLFTGNYTDTHTPNNAPADISFDFIANGSLAPASLQLEFGTGMTGGTPDPTVGDVWYANLNPNAALNQWVTYTVPSVYGVYLGGPGSDQTTFNTDITQVSWIGVSVERNGLNAQSYYLDNVMLYVPEPGEVSLIATALVGLAFTLRRKLTDSRTTTVG